MLLCILGHSAGREPKKTGDVLCKARPVVQHIVLGNLTVLGGDLERNRLRDSRIPRDVAMVTGLGCVGGENGPESTTSYVCSAIDRVVPGDRHHSKASCENNPPVGRTSKEICQLIRRWKVKTALN